MIRASFASHPICLALASGLVLAVFALFLLTAISIQTVQCQDGGQGGSIDVPPPTPATNSGSGSSSHRQIDFDRVLKAVQEGKQKKPDKFEELKKLLYIEPFSTVPYSTNLSLALATSGNKTLTRNDKLTITATVANPNPIEIRRALYIYLQSLEPGDDSFKIVNPVAQIIQINEYDDIGNGKNITARVFPDLTSFNHLKTAGPVVLRLSVSDGQYNWLSQNLTLNVTNRPPKLENISIWPNPNPRYNDAILYLANLTDPDGDEVNITLHVIDDHDMEKGNITQVVAGKGQARFLGNEFFSKSDAGKNFTYYYTFGDGIASNATSVREGPNLRKRVSINVEKPWVTPEDENQYWWQNYNFTLRMKNQGPEEAKVQVTLFTDTIAHPWRAVASKEVTLTQEPQVVYFNAAPFDVMDANQTFGFKFAYSEYDQHEQDNIESGVSKPLNPKLIRYAIYSPLMIFNIALLILLPLILFIAYRYCNCFIFAKRKKIDGNSMKDIYEKGGK